MRTYPMVMALVRHGSLMSAVVALAVVALGVYFTVAGQGIVFSVAGAVFGVVLYALLKSYSELVAIIADMMLPK